MCQSVIEVYTCGCEGAFVAQKCPQPEPRCATLLRLPNPLTINASCDTHGVQHPLQSTKRQSRPPSSYYNNRKNPFQRPQTAADIPAEARNSSQRARRGPKRSSKSRRGSRESADSYRAHERRNAYAHLTGEPRPLARAASLPLHAHNRPSQQQSVTYSSIAKQTPAFSVYTASVYTQPEAELEGDSEGENEYKLAALRVRRSLEEWRRQNFEGLDEQERYAMFLGKDRKKVEDYKRKKAEIRAGRRPGHTESLRQRTDGICLVM
jgi:hypothetical protein